ncbi:hypothetical protein SAMN02745168_0539 [Papillibacter cinnamivorans DSM 12816]|uniref:Uncharacterized protein n=1 Tax=Papillibacter cinnamivorans DSM 12816 TaxID=1122930 RepID=A0A1W1YMJ8_9FIRM|nr:hypothetical protein SAMN02745168_0539 [Papillibacter cinnamivorans DSM 12816]
MDDRQEIKKDVTCGTVNQYYNIICENKREEKKEPEKKPEKPCCFPCCCCCCCFPCCASQPMKEPEKKPEKPCCFPCCGGNGWADGGKDTNWA